ncbi:MULTISPECIES: cytochrome-c oxidase, cbb3-type subunit III [unclassified Mesorhizobium]|uniref:cytochrome-c oxidase, cbb3-type subunit III n=1 Tax=unclassified Mesorhizobium TaxID=325217 RepID=UPI0009610525|nr:MULTISPECIES: cytochrome-c oxidase, cbb3-type subunit III [unclassified Mesorhizobium]MBN9257469.1 cytochrome-c oxidase, cbb3-type subunit III [Mesorhizobium sp.]OJX87534.1 MAG: cytochrome-c oxidase, cbb3-type subunit III [Mesorhizobium sp. 65-26]
MELDKRDVVTGRPTTGHEWNGIEELETPIPRVVFFFLGTAFVFSLICWMLYPTWPLIWTYTKGMLGTDQKQVVAVQVEDAALSRATWTSEIEKKSYAEIEADPALMRSVKETGHTLFGDNCAACHGVNATGGAGFPNLAAKAWLWGDGSPEALEETIRVGINSTNDDTRTSQMLAFGHDGMLPTDQIEAVVAYVRSLSSLEPAGDAKRIEAGKQVFAANCVACHGEDAKGKRDVGAPDLTDANWLYGSDAQSVFTTVYSGRQGHMPNWAARLSPLDIKILTVYVHTLEKKPQ